MVIPSCKTAAFNAGLRKDEINKLLEIAKHAAEKGGASLMNNYGRIKTIKCKGTAGAVSYTHLTLPTIYSV